MDAFRSLEPASVFVEWRAQPGLKVRDMQGLLERGRMCCDLYHVHLQECLFNEAGSRHICRFSAPDAESVRNALRAVEVEADSIWAGRVYAWQRQLNGNVVIELKLNRQRRKSMSDTLRDIDTEWGQQYGLQLARAMVSLDNHRGIFLCYAANREIIDRAAVGMGGEGKAVWSYRPLMAKGA